MRLFFFISTVFSQFFGNGFIDDFAYVDVTLNLNNASYAGKLIDYEESKIEVYRGNNF